MTYRTLVTAFLACGFAATLSYAAQRPGATTDSKETSTATVTGCVQPGAGPKTFVLAESPSALAPAGAATPPLQARDRGTRYELVSDGTLDLSKLVGRQVEASGIVSKPAAPSDDQKSTKRADVLPKFSLKSLRETGASC